MLGGTDFYFQLLCMHILTVWAKKLGGAAPPHNTALHCLAALDAD